MAVLPLAVLILSMYFFVMTPVENTITRTMEYEADISASTPASSRMVKRKLT